MISIKHALAALPLSLALLASSAVGIANAQVVYTTTTSAPMLNVQLLSQGLTQNPSAGTQNATMAVIRLDTTGSSEDVRLNGLPLILATGNSAAANSLQNCYVANANNITTPLNSGSNTVSNLTAGNNVINFNNSVILPRNTVTTLDLVCNLAANATQGGSYTFSLNSGSVVASGVTTGTPAVVTAGTVTNTGGGTVINYPGLPNTGAGGDAPRNIAIIAGLLILASLGFVTARRYAR